MTLSATDWDASNGEVDHLPSDPLTLVKGRLNHPAPATFSSAVPTVPDHEVDDLSWLEPQFTMQSRGDHEANRSVWTQGNSPWMTGSSDGQVIVSPNVNPPVPNDSTLDAIINEAVHAVDVPLRHTTYQDDELLSWLQYPLDYPLDRGSDWLGDLPNSVKVGKHSLDGLSSKPQEASLTPPGTGFRGIVPPSPGVSGLSIRSTISQNREPTGSSGGDSPEEENEVAGADAAAAVGAGWVADLSCQSGAEVFNEVRDTVMQPPLTRCLHTAASNANMKTLDVASLVRKPPHRSSSQRQNRPKLDPVAFFTPPPPQRRPGARNFSLFSRPVAETKASLHMVGAGSGPTNIERVRKQYGKSARVALNAKESSLEETITTVSDRGSDVAQIQVGEAIQYYETLEIRQITPSSSCGQQSDKERGNGICKDSNLNSSVCFSAVTASEKGVEILEAADQTATSLSGGSGNSTDKSGKEAATTFNRKFSAGDDSEYQSEDVEEEDANNNKKPTSGIKRSRAAEIHNQSERRRRDRINEKMKALQDLIPNANKTDKVSMLDEVIEYMKLLQSQLQTMSMRTGIGIPPTMIPSMGMQHLQMPPLPHVGMGMGMGVGLGMGMGMGMGMGLMDVNAAAGRMMMPMPPLHCQLPVGAPSHVAGLQVCTPPLSMAETHDHLQNSSIMDHYNPYLAHQQIQPASLNLNMQRNMELYNAYMQQQHHHHQQQWQQHMQ